MAGVNVPFNGFSLVTQRVLGPADVPAGLSSFKVTFDMAGFTVGQSVQLLVELSDDGGATWPVSSSADFNGPSLDKHGVLQTTTFLTLTLVNRVTGPNAKIRGTMIPTNGPVAIGAGTLQAA